MARPALRKFHHVAVVFQTSQTSADRAVRHAGSRDDVGDREVLVMRELRDDREVGTGQRAESLNEPITDCADH